jgi:hypothetical protein
VIKDLWGARKSEKRVNGSGQDNPPKALTERI